MAHPCERVLVVDDDADTRDVVAMLLEQQGIATAVAADAAEALEILRSGYRPDVILLDLVMPGVSGRALRMRLKLEPAFRDIPVVLCTASPQLAREDDEFAAVIAKPFDADAFFAALAELCLDAPRRRAS